MGASPPSRTKHRRASINYAAEYEDRLQDGTALGGSGHTVMVGQRDDTQGGKWVDKTDEFGPPSATVQDTQVQFTLGAASGGEQAEGAYYVVVLASVDNGETLPAVMELEVTAEADAEAPAL